MAYGDQNCSLIVFAHQYCIGKLAQFFFCHRNPSGRAGQTTLEPFKGAQACIGSYLIPSQPGRPDGFYRKLSDFQAVAQGQCSRPCQCYPFFPSDIPARCHPILSLPFAHSYRPSSYLSGASSQPSQSHTMTPQLCYLPCPSLAALLVFLWGLIPHSPC